MGLYYEIVGNTIVTVETAIVFAISIILLYIKPGPNQAMKITRAMNDGFLPAWYFTLGATSVVAFYFTVAAIGAGIAENVLDSVGFYFKLIGGGYLLYLGYKGLNNINRGVWTGRVDVQRKRAFVENYMIGVVVTLANPITIFYFLGIVPNLMTLGDLNIHGIIAGIAVIFIVGNLSDIILIALVAQVREALSDTKFVKNINIFLSIGFTVIGAFFVFSAFFLNDFSYRF